MRCVALLLFLTSAAPALAVCPRATDLDHGIGFDIAGGEQEEFRRTGDHMIESRYYFDAESGARNLLAQGVYLVEVVDLEHDRPVPATRATYSYPLQPDQMPVPVPGARWDTGVVILSSEGISSETQVYTFGEMTRISFGDCTYDMMPIQIGYRAGSESSEQVDLIHWLPELGISYLAGSVIDGQEDTYDYIAVYRLP